MEPIATYTEQLVQVSRTFELYEDRVEVHARWLLKGRFDSTIRLATLKPEPREVMIRYRLFKHAVLMFAGGVAVAALASRWQPGRGWTPLWAAAMVVAIIGLGLAIRTFRKVRFVRFDTKSGRGGLDIACAGPQAGQFQGFVNRVRKQIRLAAE